MKSNKIFVTGKNGFIGTHLCNRIAHPSNTVFGDCTDPDGFDISNIRELKSTHPDKIEAIVHLAAKTSIDGSLNNPHETYYNNVLGTLNILEFARLRNIHKIINLSTYVYGPPQYLPIDEKHPVNPHSPYNKSKLLAEELCLNYSKDFGIDIVTLRPFNVYGYKSKSYTLISSLIEQIKNNEKVSLSAKDVRRDFLFVEDFVNLLIIILSQFPPGYNVYNVGYGESYTLEEVTEIIADILRKRVSICYNKSRPSNIMHISADTSKVTSGFGWRPVINLEKGLRTTVLHSSADLALPM